jgi:septal ring factor EnvC (AmiA/AmiB activator)
MPSFIEAYHWTRSASFGFIRSLTEQLSRQRKEIHRVQAEAEFQQKEKEQLEEHLSGDERKMTKLREALAERDEEMYVSGRPLEPDHDLRSPIVQNSRRSSMT